MTANNSLQLKTNYRQILKIALPISAAILVPQINFVVNNIFLGGLGEQPLAIAGITGVTYLIFAVIGHGLNNGLQALMSRKAGENNPGGIGAIFKQGVLIALGLAAFAISFQYLLMPMILRKALSSAENYQMALQFLHIRVWGLPFLYLFQMRNALLVATNHSNYLIAGTLAEAATNIGLDYGLIYGHWGLPQLGFNGAAVASVIAEGVGLLVVYLICQRQGINRLVELAKGIKADSVQIKKILIQSLPLIMQYLISIVSWEYFYILIEHYGNRDLAVSNTMRNVLGLFGCISWAFASTSNTMVGNLAGQGQTSAIIPLVWRISGLSALCAIIAVTFTNLFPGIFLGLYRQSDEFIAYALPVLRVVSIASLMMSIAPVWLNALVGLGKTKITLGIEVITIILYVFYVTVVLTVYHLPLTWAWASEWLYWVTMFSLAYLALNKILKKENSSLMA